MENYPFVGYVIKYSVYGLLCDVVNCARVGPDPTTSDMRYILKMMFALLLVSVCPHKSCELHR